MKDHARRRPPLPPHADASVLDLVDHVLNKGVLLDGEVVLGLAGIDLVYLRLSALLCAADRVLGPAVDRRRRRRAATARTPAIARAAAGATRLPGLAARL